MGKLSFCFLQFLCECFLCYTVWQWQCNVAYHLTCFMHYCIVYILYCIAWHNLFTQDVWVSFVRVSVKHLCIYLSSFMYVSLYMWSGHSREFCKPLQKACSAYFFIHSSSFLGPPFKKIGKTLWALEKCTSRTLLSMALLCMWDM